MKSTLINPIMIFFKKIFLLVTMGLFISISYSQEKKVVLNFKSIHMEWEGKPEDAPVWVNRNSTLTLEGSNVTFEMDGVSSLFRRTNTPSKRLKTQDGITYAQSEYLNEINKICFIQMLLTDRMQVRIIEDNGSVYQMSKDIVEDPNDESSESQTESDCREVQNEFIACGLYNQELLQEINTLKDQNSQLIFQSKEMTILTTKGAENIEKALQYIKTQDLKITKLQDDLIKQKVVILKLSNKN